MVLVDKGWQFSFFALLCLLRVVLELGSDGINNTVAAGIERRLSVNHDSWHSHSSVVPSLYWSWLCDLLITSRM